MLRLIVYTRGHSPELLGESQIAEQESGEEVPVTVQVTRVVTEFRVNVTGEDDQCLVSYSDNQITWQNGPGSITVQIPADVLKRRR